MPFTFVSVVMPIFMVMAVRLIPVRLIPVRLIPVHMVRMPTRFGRHLISMAMTLVAVTVATTANECRQGKRNQK